MHRKEVVTVSFKFNIEYVTSAGREHLIDRIKDSTRSFQMVGAGVCGKYEASPVPDSAVLVDSQIIIDPNSKKPSANLLPSILG